MSDLIIRADAIEAVKKTKPIVRSTERNWGKMIAEQHSKELVKALKALPSADAVPTVIRAKTFMRKEDFDKWAEDIKKQNKSIVFIPCDAEVVSADAEQGEWIPCSERLPKELERVNVTWLNHNPPFYYQHIKDIPQTDTAVYYRGKWYWWDVTVIDILAEYGEDCNAEQIDKDIEVVAWMPLPKPYKGGDDE